jgi:hypothetical protein
VRLPMLARRGGPAANKVNDALRNCNRYESCLDSLPRFPSGVGLYLRPVGRRALVEQVIACDAHRSSL